ncbi:MAG: RICIN domain-containing protein, partial [Egibacteraceae bacterium]
PVDEASSTYQIVARHSDMAMDLARWDGADTATIQQFDASWPPKENQQWQLIPSMSVSAHGSAEILKDVREIGAPGSPGYLAVWGQDTFVVIAGTHGKPPAPAPVVVAGTWEQGRVVAFSHDGYLGKAAAEQADTGRLVENALVWASRKPSPRVAYLGHEPPARLNAQALPRKDLTPTLVGLDALILSLSDLSDAEIDAVSTFVRGGGGLLAALTGWGWLWLQGAGGRPMSSNALNRLVAPAGIGWTDGMAEKTTKSGYAASPVPPLAHGLHAFEALLATETTNAKAAHTDAELQQAADAAQLPSDSCPRMRRRYGPASRRSSPSGRRH